MFQQSLVGFIEVICGSMFSGKTEELLRRIRRAQIGRQKIQLFKPSIDTRYSADHIQSHDANRLQSHPVGRPFDILQLMDDNTRVVGIDEAQFFDDTIVDVAQKLANRGIRVIVAGLDLDFLGQPFGPMPRLLAVAETVTKLSAVCVLCGKPASRTQRVSGSLGPAGERVAVGAREMYEARCRSCHDPELAESASRETAAAGIPLSGFPLSGFPLPGLPLPGLPPRTQAPTAREAVRVRTPTPTIALDSQFTDMDFTRPEIEHGYGPNVHILSDLFLLSHLAQLCAQGTQQPVINELVTTLYSSLLKLVVNREFPSRMAEIPTRMITSHPEGTYRGPIIDPQTPVVTVNLARAGTLPSHICYTALNYFMSPERVRQDHVSIGRTTDEQEKVTGSKVSGHKIGGTVDDAIVLFPDPMGATGSTLVEAVGLYKKNGRALKYVALHCIVTPEYLRNVTTRHPDLHVYAVRLDRGLSPADVLATAPGTHWERERGLNAKQYIVPGGGGFGEIMNNAYV